MHRARDRIVSADRGGPNRRPPDDTQRSTRLWIFGILAALLLVLGFVERAFQSDERQETNPPQSAAARTAELQTGPTGQSPVAQVESGPAEQAWEQGWRDVGERLPPAERTLLDELLYAAERHQALTDAKASAGADLLASVRSQWEEYLAAARQSLESLDQAEHSSWNDALRQVERRWASDVKPTLQGVLDGRTLTDFELQTLSTLQRTLEMQSLEQIEDDTVFLRPAELDAWLRLAGKALHASPEELQRQSVGEASYVELAQQPAEYRGRAVAIHGTVKRAYRVPAEPNYLGVEAYHVLWIMPAGGATSPVVVYALDLPPGFPALTAGENGRLHKFHEEVRVTGYFLKRGAYLGQDGTYTAPLVIANAPEWFRREPTLADAARFSLGDGWFWPAVGGALAAATAIFGLVYWRIRAGEAEARQIFQAGLSSELAGVADLTLRPSTADALRALEQEARRGRQR